MTTTTDTQETPAVQPTRNLTRLLIELMIVNHLEEIARREAEVKFLKLLESLLEGK